MVDKILSLKEDVKLEKNHGNLEWNSKHDCKQWNFCRFVCLAFPVPN